MNALVTTVAKTVGTVAVAHPKTTVAVTNSLAFVAGYKGADVVANIKARREAKKLIKTILAETQE